jgi:D-alanine-D-alanine ligase
MGPRLKIALLCGGRSGEHEVSLRSAASVGKALSERHDVMLIVIDQEGRWFLQEGPAPEEGGGREVFLVPGLDNGRLRDLADARPAAEPDIYFPLLHGTYGEDGTIQGLLELAAVPYVGSGVAASAVGMDKEFMRALFAQDGLPLAPYRVIRKRDSETESVLLDVLGLPLFIKPANLGSSVGISKVKTPEELSTALDRAFVYDNKVIAEVAINAREIEVSVLGNEDPSTSLPGEIVPDREFYDYESKYSASSRTELRIPAALEPQLAEEARDCAARAFRAIDAAGFARVDLFLDRTSGRFVVNEINTIPGFTSISMFPKLWEATGLPYCDLLDRLLDLGRARHEARSHLLTQYRP